MAGAATTATGRGRGRSSGRAPGGAGGAARPARGPRGRPGRRRGPAPARLGGRGGKGKHEQDAVSRPELEYGVPPGAGGAAFRGGTWFESEALELLRRRGRVSGAELGSLDHDQIRDLLVRHGFMDRQGQYYGPSGFPMVMPHPDNPVSRGPTRFPDVVWCAEQMGWDWRKNPWIPDTTRARMELWEARTDLRQRVGRALRTGEWDRVEGWFRRVPTELYDGEVGHFVHTQWRLLKDRMFPQRTVPMVGDQTISYARLLELMEQKRVKRITIFNGGGDALVEVPSLGCANEFIYEEAVQELEPDGGLEMPRYGIASKPTKARLAQKDGAGLPSLRAGVADPIPKYKVNNFRYMVEAPEFTMEKERFYCPLPGDLWEDGRFMEIYKRNMMRRDPATGEPDRESKLLADQCYTELVVHHREPLFTMAGRIIKYSPPLLGLLLFDAVVVAYIKYKQKAKEAERKKKDKAKKSPALAFNVGEGGRKTMDLTLDDVAGLEGVKQRVREIMKVLVQARSFTDIGIRPPRGILLYGPPGTGKTLIAKGVAGEFNVPFFACSGSEFVDMYPGVAAQRLKDLFQQARDNAPAVVFIDEVDAIAKTRTSGELTEQDQGLFQLLVEMDGVSTYDERVLLIAATNLKSQIDPAMLRPGRLERHFYIDKPNLANRLAVLKVHAKKKVMVPFAGHPRFDDGDELLRAVAAQTAGYNGASLENLLNEGTIIAVRRGLDLVNLNILTELVEERGPGAPQGALLATEAKARLARFHAARAVVRTVSPKLDSVQLVSLQQRHGRVTGVINRREDSGHLSMLGWFAKARDWHGAVVSDFDLFKAMLVHLFVGRVQEELDYGPEGISSRSAFEASKAHELARSLVADWNLDPDWVAPYPPSVKVWAAQPYKLAANPALLAKVDQTLRDVKAKASQLVTFYAPVIDEVAARLGRDEDVSGDALRGLVADFEAEAGLAWAGVAAAGGGDGREYVAASQYLFFCRAAAGRGAASAVGEPELDASAADLSERDRRVREFALREGAAFPPGPDLDAEAVCDAPGAPVFRRSDEEWQQDFALGRIEEVGRQTGQTGLLPAEGGMASSK